MIRLFWFSQAPRARDVLSACARGDWSAAAFPWLSLRECFVGIAPATVMNLSFSGELAYEIHVPNASLYATFLALRQAGKAFGLTLFGARAVDSMRMEKSFLHWKADLITEFDPFETGLDRFVRLEKGDFIGRDALLKRKSEGLRKKVGGAADRCDPCPGASWCIADARRLGCGHHYFGRMGASHGLESGTWVCRPGFCRKRL